MRTSAAVLLALSFTLAACGGNGDETEFPQDDAGLDGAEVQPFTDGGRDVALELGPDFTTLQIGQTLQGTAGAESTSEFTGPGGAAGRVRSYVACPADAEGCDGGELAEGQVYTYVAEVTPGARASVFRTAQPVGGFTAAGFDQAQADAAIGGDSQLAMRCVNGALVWAVSGGEGWNGAPITFYWQSTSPPEEASQAYQLIADGETSTASGPMPTEGSTDGCG